MAKSTTRAVSVEGLADFQRELRALDAQLPRELQKTNKRAAEHMALRARGRALSLGGVAAHVAPSIKAAAQQRYAMLNVGGPKWPMAMGANFGAGHNIPRLGNRLGWNQFPEWGGNQFTGGANDRFIYWTIVREQGEWTEMYGHMLDELAARAFPN
jgi:hypothetical protein